MSDAILACLLSKSDAYRVSWFGMKMGQEHNIELVQAGRYERQEHKRVPELAHKHERVHKHVPELAHKHVSELAHTHERVHRVRLVRERVHRARQARRLVHMQQVRSRLVLRSRTLERVSHKSMRLFSPRNDLE